jgi:hypothetical protein
MQGIANLNQPPRFDPMAIQMHLTTVDGLGCQRTRLEKARCP